MLSLFVANVVLLIWRYEKDKVNAIIKGAPPAATRSSIFSAWKRFADENKVDKKEG